MTPWAPCPRRRIHRLPCLGRAGPRLAGPPTTRRPIQPFLPRLTFLGQSTTRPLPPQPTCPLLIRKLASLPLLGYLEPRRRERCRARSCRRRQCLCRRHRHRRSCHRRNNSSNNNNSRGQGLITIHTQAVILSQVRCKLNSLHLFITSLFPHILAIFLSMLLSEHLFFLSFVYNLFIQEKPTKIEDG